MTIKDAIFELELIKNADAYVTSRLTCIIEDLTAFMNAVGNEYEINNAIARQIEKKSSRLETVDHSWVNTLYCSVLNMFRYEKCKQYYNQEKNGKEIKKVIDGETSSKWIEIISAIWTVLACIVAGVWFFVNKTGFSANDDGKFDFDKWGFVILLGSSVLVIVVSIIMAVVNTKRKKDFSQNADCPYTAAELLDVKYENKTKRLGFLSSMVDKISKCPIAIEYQSTQSQGNSANAENGSNVYQNNGGGDLTVITLGANTGADRQYIKLLKEIRDILSRGGEKQETKKWCENIDKTLQTPCSDITAILSETTENIKGILNSFGHDTQVLKKADEIVDNIEKLYAEEFTGQSGDSELALLRGQIYRDALRNEYNDIYMYNRPTFRSVGKYRKKLIVSVGNICEEDLRSLEKRIIDLLNPNPETVKREADAILDELKQKLKNGNEECLEALMQYCNAVRNEYNDIYLNKKTSFTSVRESRNILADIAKGSGIRLDEDVLKGIERQIISILRPDVAASKAKADKIVNEFFDTILNK